jgi:uncharacterized protein YbaR (Trm112 family)
MPDSPPNPTLPQQDLQWLACPVCRESLTLEVDSVRCNACQRRYPILDGISILLAERVS